MLLWGSIVALEKMSGAEWSLGGDDRGDALPRLSSGIGEPPDVKARPHGHPTLFCKAHFYKLQRLLL